MHLWLTRRTEEVGFRKLSLAFDRNAEGMAEFGAIGALQEQAALN
jgi:hypothetical protein